MGLFLNLLVSQGRNVNLLAPHFKAQKCTFRRRVMGKGFLGFPLFIAEAAWHTRREVHLGAMFV